MGTQENKVDGFAVILAGVGALAYIVLFMAYFALMRGILVMYLWNWFMPFAFGLPEINVPIGYGLTLLFIALKGFDLKSDYDAKGEGCKTVIMPYWSILWRTGLYLGLGYIVYQLFIV